MRRLAMMVTALATLACGGALSGTPVPPEHADLVGDWTGPSHSLSITPDGMVSYERKEGGTSTSVNGGVTSWGAKEFTVLGVTTFHIEEAPHLDGGDWAMKVDGVDYERPGDGEADEGGDEKGERERPDKGKAGKSKGRKKGD